MARISQPEKADRENVDYQSGYTAGLSNADLSGPWQRGWKFRPRKTSKQWGIGHWQALEDRDWQPQDLTQAQ